HSRRNARRARLCLSLSRLARQCSSRRSLSSAGSVWSSSGRRRGNRTSAKNRATPQTRRRQVPALEGGQQALWRVNEEQGCRDVLVRREAGPRPHPRAVPGEQGQNALIPIRDLFCEGFPERSEVGIERSLRGRPVGFQGRWHG